jgi:small-conductance mechanosensitive channel/CRP-like cAMP-binding protein
MSDGGVTAQMRVRQAIGLPIALIILASLLWYFLPDSLARWEWAGESFKEKFNLVPRLLLAIGITLLLFHGIIALVERRMAETPPKLVRQVIGVVLWASCASVVAGSFFGVPLGSLVTTSGLLVAVIGLALKNMISDLFGGITLPLKIGEWIEVDGIMGRVTEVSWRATSLVTRDEVLVVIPNTHLIAKPLRNYSRPERYYRDSFKITLPNTVTAHQAERNLIAAARQIDSVAVLPIAPTAQIAAFNERGIEWELKYPVPDADKASSIRHRIKRNVMRNLHYSGIKLPRATVEMTEIAAPQVTVELTDDQAFLLSFELFTTLMLEELEVLCRGMSRRLVEAGKAIVTQGEEGDSLFVLREGLLSVTINADGIDTVVGQIVPGNFFGEMSLLTGAARSATVMPLVDSLIYEIRRDSLFPIMQGRPHLAVQMSEVLAERQAINMPKLARKENIEDSKRSLAKQLLGKISAMFRLKPQDNVQAVARGA